MEKSYLQKLSDKIGDHQYASINATCMDCGKPFTIQVERISPKRLEIKNGAIGVRRKTGEIHFKCEDCKENNNWGMPSEVYSRVVGYLRPVGDWNTGKQTEYGMRTEYSITDVDKVIETQNELFTG
jgi:hypothetical protein